MIEKAIIALLVANPALSALVGGRIRPNIVKADSQYPAIYVFGDRMEPLGCDDNSGVSIGVIEIGVLADDYATCDQAINLIRGTLDNFSGISKNVGISVQRGLGATDDYDAELSLDIKVIEYEAYAELK